MPLVDGAGRRFVHHGGSSSGGSAFLLVYPEAGLVVAMAARVSPEHVNYLTGA